MQAPPPPGDDSWSSIVNAAAVALSALGGGVVSGALVIWRAATSISTLRGEIAAAKAANAETLARLEEHRRDLKEFRQTSDQRHDANIVATNGVSKEVAGLAKEVAARPDTDDLRRLEDQMNSRFSSLELQIRAGLSDIKQTVERTAR